MRVMGTEVRAPEIGRLPQKVTEACLDSLARIRFSVRRVIIQAVLFGGWGDCGCLAALEWFQKGEATKPFA